MEFQWAAYVICLSRVSGVLNLGGCREAQRAGLRNRLYADETNKWVEHKKLLRIFAVLLHDQNRLFEILSYYLFNINFIRGKFFSYDLLYFLKIQYAMSYAAMPIVFNSSRRLQSYNG